MGQPRWMWELEPQGTKHVREKAERSLVNLTAEDAPPLPTCWLLLILWPRFNRHALQSNESPKALCGISKGQDVEHMLQPRQRGGAFHQG